MPIRIAFLIFFPTILFRSIDSTCVQADAAELACSITNATQDSRRNPRQCLTCKVQSLLNQSNAFGQCRNQYRCVHFSFTTFEMFTRFFARHHQEVTAIFNSSTTEERANNLNVKVEEDRLSELILSDLSSIVHFNRSFYPDFYLTLVEHRSTMVVYLDRDLSDVSLVGLSLSITCNQTDLVHLMFGTHLNPTNQTEKCVSVRRDRPRPRFNSTTTTPKSTGTKKRWILFLIGALLLLVWCVSLAYLFYVRSRRWRAQADPNQRTSVVSSVFSNDSFESQHEIAPMETKTNSEKASVRGLYAFDRDF